VDPVPYPYFSESLVGLGIEPGTSGSVASNSGHYTTEAVPILDYHFKITAYVGISWFCFASR
jgi:hypothetical protein